MPDIKMLCFRLGRITNTSVEFYYNQPYSDLAEFVRELSDEAKQRKRAARKK